jgi:hypothetical protein
VKAVGFIALLLEIVRTSREINCFDTSIGPKKQKFEFWVPAKARLRTLLHPEFAIVRRNPILGRIDRTPPIQWGMP